ncbi:hypothetical protein Tco_0821234 [Tanacetum coccineum]|uniref:Uncharacterized protein n=1 Tax=Tanacetum coccineum TaxID=301880 RepID=A0ABQ5ABQ0_9ASTR
MAAKEEHSTSPHSRLQSSAKGCSSSPTQMLFFPLISQRTASVQVRASFIVLLTSQGTAELQGTITPRILNFEDEAGPSSPLRQSQVMEPEEQLKAAEVLVSISRPRGLSIPGPIQTQPQQPTQGTDPKDKGKGILELYDKVQASIKDSFKDFIPMDSEKESEMLKERDAKRLLRKRKATISEEHAITEALD